MGKKLSLTSPQEETETVLGYDDRLTWCYVCMYILHVFCIFQLRITVGENHKPIPHSSWHTIENDVSDYKFINDEFDDTVSLIQDTEFGSKVEFGKNVLIGKNVSIGSNCKIGHNTILERNVVIGDNCSIGSNNIIRNTLVKNNVRILDNCVIGKHGFGFFPIKNKNLRYPHIGMVLIEDNCEIGCGATIDRGSMSNTIIGKNTYLDNQIHIAHNVKIGENSIIAGQVGIAGSSIIGKNVKIGGQAGISGHLNIGNNVEIGGGSGVIRNIPDNKKVMGYPAKNIREFLRDNKW